MKFMKKLAIILMVVVLAAAVVVWKQPLNSSRHMSSEAITSSLSDIAELSVEEYNFTRVGKYETGKWHGLPLTGGSFIITYSGTVKAGVKDMAAVKVDVNDLTKTITIKAPKVEVLSTTIDPSSVEQLDQSLNPLRQIQVQDVADFLASEERIAQQDAIDHGLLTRAAERAEQLFTARVSALIEASDSSDYTVVYQVQ